jgi:transcription elongation factor Elf1
VSRLSRKCGSLNISQPCESSWPATGIALPVFIFIYKFKMERIYNIACLGEYQATINFLSEPVDVYNDWIDACESAN